MLFLISIGKDQHLALLLLSRLRSGEKDETRNRRQASLKNNDHISGYLFPIKIKDHIKEILKVVLEERVSEFRVRRRR